MAEKAKLPPHDIDAEESVTGSVLIDSAAIDRLNPQLQSADFYSERNMLIYEACQALARRNEQINLITVAQELARESRLETCGGAAYLSHLISICPTSVDAQSYSDIVYRLSMMRRLITAGSQISDIGYQADPDIVSSLGQAENILYKLRQGQNDQNFTSLRNILDSVLDKAGLFTDDSERVANGSFSIPTGFTSLDELIGGLQQSDLIILAARPSMGKTTLALNIAQNVAMHSKIHVAFFSLEMAREPLVMRLLSSESGVSSRRLYPNPQRLTENQERKVIDAIGCLSEIPIWIDDSSAQRMSVIRNKAKRLNNNAPLGLIILDHIGKILPDGRFENREKEISYISQSLKCMAKDLKIPVIALSQLSRGVESRDDKHPRLSDLRDSGSIEQDADVVMFIYREEYYYASRQDWEQKNRGKLYPPPAEIILAKQRNGPKGEVKLIFNPDLAKFENII